MQIDAGLHISDSCRCWKRCCWSYCAIIWHRPQSLLGLFRSFHCHIEHIGPNAPLLTRRNPTTAAQSNLVQALSAVSE